MQSIIVYSLAAAIVLVASISIVYLWEKIFASNNVEPKQVSEPQEGSFRAFYHLLWILLLWSGLAVSIPLCLSYRQQLALSSDGFVRLFFGLRVALFPVLFLILLRYGVRKGYIEWIDSVFWPDEENK